MWAISCVWGVSAPEAAARIRRHCDAAGWELVDEATLGSVGDGTLGWVLGAVEWKQPKRLILTREGLAELEREFPELWGAVRGWVEDRGVSVVAV